jgi:hypothetical protein
MNKFIKIACQLTSAGVISVCGQSAHAQSLFTEAFNYPTGNLGGNVNPGSTIAWTGGNTVLSVGSTPLSYAGLQTMATTGDLVYTSGVTSASTINTYTAVTSGSIYYSFLIDCTTLPTANNYLTSLNPATTGPGGSGDSMATYVGAIAGGYKIGVRNGNSGASYGTSALVTGTTYFIVEELTLGATPTLNLFVDPVPGSTQASFGTPTSTQTGTVAVSTVDDVGFKAQSAATAGDFEFGNLLIAQDWADVTPPSVLTPEPSTYGLFALGSLAVAWKLRRQAGL